MFVLNTVNLFLQVSLHLLRQDYNLFKFLKWIPFLSNNYENIFTYFKTIFKYF